ncbi:hypothetical protein AZE42_12591 [Rhizopogon vesiculosus]|uniref:Uncharacterized protein n=1 Tax=Rhizopogon vesiculosus TaxID=180088 RepID=A0A1J8PXX1_9AGAM|nr:hypothetical protein AZE42_12591 [Rhizopogon vesiculosus]
MSLLPPVLGALPEGLIALFYEEFYEQVTRFAAEGGGVIYVVKIKNEAEELLGKIQAAIDRLNLEGYANLNKHREKFVPIKVVAAHAKLQEHMSTSNTPGTPSELPSQTQTPSGERLASPHTISVTNPGTRQHHLLNCHR